MCYKRDVLSRTVVSHSCRVVSLVNECVVILDGPVVLCGIQKYRVMLGFYIKGQQLSGVALVTYRCMYAMVQRSCA